LKFFYIHYWSQKIYNKKIKFSSNEVKNIFKLLITHLLACSLLSVTQIINIVESRMSYVKLVILGFNWSLWWSLMLNKQTHCICIMWWV
jgi:hypothetical protein